MNFFIVDDDVSVPLVLKQIIEQNFDFTVVGWANSAREALDQWLALDVDILLVDLLMAEMSGIDLVKKLKVIQPDLRVVMISQVRSSHLREDAYRGGIEFFIDKPINVIEVKTVLEKVVQNLQMEQKLNHIQNLLGDQSASLQVVVDKKMIQKEQQAKMRSILNLLGIATETGVSDILFIAEIMLEKQLHFKEINFAADYQIDEHEKKIIFQRVRRALKVGLTNLAHLCLDDYENELFINYGNALFEYKNVHEEMQYLQGKRAEHGKTSLRVFFEGLVLESQV
ncbi:DNA-binding domain-containing protein [Weissella koreensis]|uniref:DNA-binding domain-containing protein n=2 Tax=Weissella koreensis TaxID=165096 RepID=UPI0022BA2C24|nr:DNA-binding domain-containing protein [Weissella koreensis]MCZ9310983.1 DNA-binding domain-containing protein [Weissella koreensis]